MSVKTVGNNQSAEINSENAVQDNLTIYTGFQGWILAKMGYAIQIWNDADRKVVYLSLKDIVAEMTKTPNGSISGKQIGECRKVRSAAAQILNLQKAGERITGEEVVNFITDFRSEDVLKKIQSAPDLETAVGAVKDRANELIGRISLFVEHIQGESVGDSIQKCRQYNWFTALFHDTIAVLNEHSEKVYLSLPDLVAVMTNTPNKNITAQMLRESKTIRELVVKALSIRSDELTGEQLVSFVEDFRDDEDFLNNQLGIINNFDQATALITQRLDQIIQMTSEE